MHRIFWMPGQPVILMDGNFKGVGDPHITAGVPDYENMIGDPTI